MTERNPRQPDRDVPTYSSQTGSFHNDLVEEGMWNEEELERASMGWRADDEHQEPGVPSNFFEVTNAYIDADDLDETIADDLDETIADADDAIDEMRRDLAVKVTGIKPL